MDEDAALAALADNERRFIAAVWLRRATGERGAAATFGVVADGLAALDAEPELIALARRAIDDEVRHSERCWTLACRYAGSALPQPPSRPFEGPRYAAASEELRHSLHIVGQCCLNETTASAFLERSLALATAAPVRATFRELLSDEVDHARIGWAYLASPRLPAATRAAIARWLPAMIASNLEGWCARPDAPDEPVYAAHGVLPRATVAQAATAAADELIVPGLAHVGIVVPRATASP